MTLYNQLTGIRYFHVMNISFFQCTSTKIIFSNKLDLKSIASYEYPMMTINEKLIIQSTIRSKSDTQSIRYMTDHLPKKSGMANLILKDRTPSLSALVFKAIFKLFFYVFH
jgi:hypothetical protein